MEPDKKPDRLRSAAGKAFKAVSKGVQNLGNEVIEDTHEIKDELIKYGKNRLVAGGALALKGAFIGAVAGPIGVKGGAVAGFVIGFFGGPPVANAVEKWLAGKKPANDSSPPPSKKPDDEPELPFDNPSPR